MPKYKVILRRVVTQTAEHIIDCDPGETPFDKASKQLEAGEIESKWVDKDIAGLSHDVSFIDAE
ncbi:hypothetical protein CC53_gp093 [Rhizobium phage vB_RleS_L338C]|uniref:hypothetical protein n=1 Tax=Rhizobium phage vB_RleS_L338C TaxID=1414737 RepID=UPI0003D84367|nr:hypothetical protein CC53_gp093 [Rhizobium phage vB_RleS_L338C]AHC30510.1 hypothetical protein L338C_093 [Rhizobium phage vB_RleS_L338C]QNH72188.1 hypothetical protein P11VFA_058 [Rhizobium phage P11VFA]